MRHMHREEAQIQQLLRTTRTIAVIGASPRPERRSHEVVRYLRLVGYDVIPIRPDRVQVDGLPTYARLDDVAGPVDLVVVYRRPSASVTHIVETVRKRAAYGFRQAPGTAERKSLRDCRTLP